MNDATIAIASLCAFAALWFAGAWYEERTLRKRYQHALRNADTAVRHWMQQANKANARAHLANSARVETDIDALVRCTFWLN